MKTIDNLDQRDFDPANHPGRFDTPADALFQVTYAIFISPDLWPLAMRDAALQLGIEDTEENYQQIRDGITPEMAVDIWHRVILPEATRVEFD